ncbi:MAG: hypothetical protein ACOZQL_32415 [Myxococcota bacterium]
MSLRDELEQVQVQLRLIDQQALTTRQLSQLADQLEREASAWEQRLAQVEARTADESRTTAARLSGFGFTLLFVTPIVAMVGTALARLLRGQVELGVVLLVVGVLTVGAGLSVKVRRSVARVVSREWRLVRAARTQAARLREHL